MEEAKAEKIIFSSSATMHGEENKVPYEESIRKDSCTNPYRWTKSMKEQVLSDTAYGRPPLSVIILRYFNPIGIHESSLIGEYPQDIPNNLIPFISQIAVGKKECLTIWGNEYNTLDGTCRRDYIYVVDLVKGHVEAVEYVLENQGVEVFTLGTGVPYSVTETISLVKANRL